MYKNFKNIRHAVNYILNHNQELNVIELNYIFNNIVYKNSSDKYLNPTYKKLFRAVKYLLENLEVEQQELFVKLLNNDFEFEIEYRINCNFDDDNFLGDEFAGYSFTCTNPETSRFLIELVSKLKTKQKNSALEDFKNSL